MDDQKNCLTSKNLLQEHYESISDIDQLKKEIWEIHIKLWTVTETQTFLTDRIHIYVNKINKLMIDSNGITNVKSIGQKHLNELIASIMALIDNKNDSQLNNEILQIGQLVKNVKHHYKDDVKIIYDAYVKELPDVIPQFRKSLIKEIGYIKRHTPHEANLLKQKYDSYVNIAQLQKQAYNIHLKYLDVLERQDDLINVTYKYMTQIAKQAFDLKFVRQNRDIMDKHFNQLNASILALATKENGNPLNNEMGKIITLVQNVNQSYIHDFDVFKLACNRKLPARGIIKIEH